MTVKELKEILDKYPEEMLVVTTMYSCMDNLKPPEEIEVFGNPGGWYEEFYQPQWERKGKTKPLTFKVLHFEGN